MTDKKQSYARYCIVRGNQTLWKGDPTINGAKCRQIVITSNEFSSLYGIFQVYCVEGTSKGIVGGSLSVPGPFEISFDQDFQGVDAASKKFHELTEESERQGFKRYSASDEIEFQQKLRQTTI